MVKTGQVKGTTKSSSSATVAAALVEFHSVRNPAGEAVSYGSSTSKKVKAAENLVRP